jgi:hypothetical protein
MKFLVLALAVIAAGILGIGLIHTASKSRLQKQVPNNNQIGWHIQQAKIQGQRKVSIQSPVVEYLGSANEDVDKALSEYTVVVAEPVASRTYEHTGDTLITWYKFKILEPLTDIRPALCAECNSLSPPPDMLPVLAGEFLIPRQGGAIEQEGIELTQVDPAFPPFKQGQKYLMLISLYPTAVAFTAGGPIGVFRIDGGEKLSALTEEPHKIKEGIISAMASGNLPCFK